MLPLQETMKEQATRESKCPSLRGARRRSNLLPLWRDETYGQMPSMVPKGQASQMGRKQSHSGDHERTRVLKKIQGV